MENFYNISQKFKQYLLPFLRDVFIQYASVQLRWRVRKFHSFLFEIEFRTLPRCWHVCMAFDRFIFSVCIWKHFDSNRIHGLEVETAQIDGKMAIISTGIT